MSSQILTQRSLSMGDGPSNVPKLPQIEHPLSRLSGEPLADVRGYSRSGSRPVSQSLGRPMSQEVPAYATCRRVSSHRSNSRAQSKVNRSAPEPMFSAIPEGVEVTLGDNNKTKLPIFGNKADMASREDIASRAQSRISAIATERLEMDELEALIRDKVKNNYYEMRKKFIDNDPEQKGNVTRDALLRILVTSCGRPITSIHLSNLLQRLGMRPDKPVINFTDFFTAFRICATSEYPRWMDPVQRHHQEKVKMNADEVHRNLQEKIRQRFIDLADVFPQFIDGGTGRLLKAELRNALNKMLFFMDEEEFEKLWRKYDPEHSGAVSGVNMLKKMGITMRAAPPATGRRKSPPESRMGSTARGGARRRTDRQRQLDVEKWLKDKFREGFYSMRNSFEEADTENCGLVPVETFLKILNQYGLNLERKHLTEFLARCVVEIQRDGVPYRDFLHRFQDRSDAGMAHKILSNPHHDFHGNKGSDAFSALESQIMNMFQRDFLSLLGTFQKCDRWNTGVLAPEEFRAAIEARFELGLTDQQFEKFLDKVPLNDDGLVKYDEFMKQFDTRGMAPSLFHKVRSSDIVPDIMEEEEEEPDVDRLIVHRDQRRGVDEIREVIRNLMDNRYQDLERCFHEIDEYNSQRLTQEMMYSLLNRMGVQPEVTRGEIRDLWKTFILNEKQTLEFKEFVRSFIYDARTSSFPNAKVVPPRRGDADYMMRSRKLNCAADMLQDNLRSKVDFMWDRLRMEFTEMDPYNTGFVSKEEFHEVLKELCVQLSDHELLTLTKKFDIRRDGRVSYAEFLKPFAQKRQVWRHGNNMLSLLQHPQSELPLNDIGEPPNKGLPGITGRLRQKLAGEWKNLRRAFRKLDSGNTGYLSMPEFRSVLKLANILLDEEEVYQMMSQFDEDMTGKIPYKRILDDLKPSSRSDHLISSRAE